MLDKGYSAHMQCEAFSFSLQYLFSPSPRLSIYLVDYLYYTAFIKRYSKLITALYIIKHQDETWNI